MNSLASPASSESSVIHLLIRIRSFSAFSRRCMRTAVGRRCRMTWRFSAWIAWD